MAKFGEGDARWIVADRSDGTNVNNWHWSEKDCTEWVKGQLNDRFASLVLVDADGWRVSTLGLESFSGEAFLNNRKGKVIAAYELDVKVKWQANTHEDGQSITAAGLIHFPYIADENCDEEPEIRITTEDNKKTGQQAKQILLSQAKQLLLDTVRTVLKELQGGGPAQDCSGQAVQPSVSKPKLSSAAVESVRPKQDKAPKSTSSLKLTERFYARPVDIFEVFTQEGRVKAFTQSDARVEPKVGGSFSWFNGSVHGVFRELTERRLEMDWRFSNWEDDRYSKVVIQLQEPDPGNTVLTLTQTNIPAADKFGNEGVFDVVEHGWKMNIFQRIRAVFGFGV